MALRSRGRKLSFEILSDDNSVDDEIFFYRSVSDLAYEDGGDADRSDSPDKHRRRKRKNKGSKKKKKKLTACAIDEEEQVADKVVDSVFVDQKPLFYENGSACSAVGLDLDCQSYRSQTVIREQTTVAEQNEGSVRMVHQTTVAEQNEGSVRMVHQTTEPESNGNYNGNVELRQRSVSGGGACDELVARTDETAKEESRVEGNSSGKRWSEANGSVVTRLETSESLDWKRLMAENSTYLSSVEKSSVKYLMEELFSQNSLRSTTTAGNEKERERVYDTIFRLPWRCELLIAFGFFVCLDSFLSLLTIMPTRMLMITWRFLNTRQFQRPSAAHLSDFSCFIVLACGITLLQQTDISLIYHMIRGQGTIKLYVVYNVLEIFDKLCQSFGGEVFQTLFNSADGLATCFPENMRFWLWRFISDLALAVVASIVHSFILLAQAITLSTCIVAHNNALLALLVSNNFAEIKSNVFKRFSKDNIHSMVYYDSVERFHILSFVLFVLAQNILEAEGPWFESFLFNALLIYFCEVIIDIIKHSFIAKFNEIKPTAYSEFLEDLCKQTLKSQAGDGKKNLTFVPLAPACVVIRVLTPVYAALLPHGHLPWRLLWIFLLSAMTFVMLASLKVIIAMALQKHATWYINRCEKRKHHLHYD